jgi:hypothetical protein
VNSGTLAFNYGDSSPFTYYGPYLDAAGAQAAAAAQVQKIRIDPIPDASHFVQLVYSAKWVPIVNQASVVMLPDEGTYAMEAKATAKLMRLNGDTLALDFETASMQLETRFLSWMRARQIQQLPTMGQYLGCTL